LATLRDLLCYSDRKFNRITKGKSMNKVINQLSLALLLTLAVACEKKEKTQESTDKKEIVEDKASETSGDEDKSSKKVSVSQDDSNASESKTEVKIEDAATGDKSKVVAEFPDGTKITMSQVYEQLNLLPPEVRDKSSFSKLYAALLRRLIDMQILSKAAKDAGMDKDASIKDQIEKNAETLLQRLYIEEEVKKLLTEDELKKNFEELKSKLPKDEMEVQLKHILIKTKEEAEALIKELTTDSAKFSDTAKQKSLDAQTKANGGDLGFVRRGALPEAFAKVVFEAVAGTVIPQAIDMGPQGFSVVYVGDKRPVQPPKLEQVRGELEKALLPKYAAQVIEKLKKQSGVEVIGLDGKPVVDKTPEQLKEEAEKGIKKPEVDMAKIDKNMVVAKFKDDTKITVKDVLDAVATLPPQLQGAPISEIFEPLLLRQVDMKIVLDAAKASGLAKDPVNVQKLDDIRKASLHKTYLDKKVSEVITDAMLKTKYQELLKLLPKNQMEIRLRHILVKTKEEAEAIIKEIKSGKSFDELVQSKSIDDKTKDKKGEIGYVRRDELPAEFGNAVFTAPKATLLPNPVNLGNIGWSVIRVEDKRNIEPPKFEEVKGELRGIVEGEKASEIMDKMREASGVKAFDMNGGTLSLKPDATDAAAQPSVK
jgi:peptidyl-prolyl cis-trans isomerase C